MLPRAADPETVEVIVLHPSESGRTSAIETCSILTLAATPRAKRH
jgi:hypothetical protein